MLKLYKKFRPIDWVQTFLIIGLTIVQVWCTMLLVDYVQDITKSIIYLNYQNQISSILPSGMSIGDISFAQILQMMTQNPGSMDSSKLTAEMWSAIQTATTGDIWFNGGMMVLVATGTAGCQFVIAVLAAYISSNFATTLRTEVNTKISNFSLAEINKFSTASLVTRATNDVQQVQMANLLVMRMVFAAPVTAIWAICKVQASSWQLTIAAAVGIVFLVICIIILMAFVMPKFKIMQKFIDKVNAVTGENLTGIRVVRAYNAEDYQESKFEKANKDLTKTQLFTGRMLGLMSPIMTLVMNGLTLAVYWIGAGLIAGNEIDYATVQAFTMLCTQIVMAFLMLMMMFILLPRANVCAKRIQEVIDTEVSVKDPEVEKPLIKGEEGTITFDHVSFAYPDAEADILQDISFTAKKGQTIAFIGSTGSGKSTLINLVTRFYDVTKGSITIDGVDVRNMKQSTLRGLVGFVPQKGLLFSGTIKSNIKFGNSNASDKDVEQACKIACADEFISKMEKGYDSPITRGGTNVSGGQRQRLCIARAIATKPEFLVFDDSFSALDFKTDKQVRENLAKSQKDVTKLIVAQRIGTIMDADTIIVLSEGKVVGEGTHKELLQNCPIYREIALSQLSEEELGL